MRLTRALWALLALMLVVALTVAWWATRPPPPAPPWVGAVRVLAGEGRLGTGDGPADSARFSEPFGVAVTRDGAVLVADAGTSNRIRRVALDGTVTTIAGGARGFEDGRGASARFATPSGVALAPDGSLVVADTGNHAVRRVAPDGAVTTVAGDGVPGSVDGKAARFRGPVGVAVDAVGRVVVADTYNDSIRIIDTTGEVRTIAGGGGAGYRDGPALEARFDTPCGVAIDSAGRILVADTGNGLIRLIAPDGRVSTVSADGVALTRPIALAVGPEDAIYVADEAGQIAALTPSSTRVLAGGSPGSADGVGAGASFRRPSGVALAAADTLVVGDAGNAFVRTISPAAQPIGSPRLDIARLSEAWPWAAVGLVAPPRPRWTPAFDVEAFARVPLLWPVAPQDGPHEVAGTFGEARGAVGQERFHAGLDVREPQGTPARAVRDGVVASPISTFAFDTLNEGVRIGDVAYIHIRVGRGPGRRADVQTTFDPARFAPVYDDQGTMLGMRAMRGARFTTGEIVGTVNAFNHVHVNVGWAGEEYDPLRFRLVQFRDGVPPTIAPHGVRLFDEAWQPLNPDRPGPPRGRGRGRRPTRLPPVEPVPVRGRVRVVVDAWDQADGNAPHRRLGVRRLGYQVLTAGGAFATGFETPRWTLRFDRMRRDAEAPRRVFAPGSGIPVYGASRTQFLYVVTASYRDGVAADATWDASALPPGTYVLRVFVEDFAANRTTRDVRVTVVP